MNSGWVMVALQNGLCVWMDARGHVVYSSRALHRTETLNLSFCLLMHSADIHTLASPPLYLPSMQPSYTQEDKSSLRLPTTSSTHALYHSFGGPDLASLSHHSCQTREESSAWAMDHWYHDRVYSLRSPLTFSWEDNSRFIATWVIILWCFLARLSISWENIVLTFWKTS